VRIAGFVGVASLAVAAVTLASFLSGASGQSQTAPVSQEATPPVDAAGNLHVPSDYQVAYEYLGSWAVADDSSHPNGSKQLHEVYASPGTIAAFRKTGQFPDGTTLVKEVFATATAPMTTGTVSRADQLQGWFVMVKDRKNDHPDNKLWGDGWGWSWFDAGKPLKTTSTDYKSDCQPCHVPAQSTDWIYSQGYAPLRR
jgi:hypothetical protein